MTPSQFRAALACLGMTQTGFAAYTGANPRTVRRWADGQQDIPPWVDLVCELTARLREIEP